MSVVPGAEPYSHQGGSAGVLLCHGFTGSPASLRPWAEYLAAEGMTVSLPRLPGHGTTWQEMNRTRWEDWYAEVDRAFGELQATTDDIFVMGLSMLGSVVPTPGGATGPFHIATAAALAFMGVDQDSAKSVAIILHPLIFAPATLFGIYYVTREGLSFGRLKNIAETHVEPPEPTGEPGWSPVRWP